MRNRAGSIRLATAGAFFAFFLFGFTDNLKGPTLPVLLPDLGFSYFQGGTILLGAYLGFLLATILTGALADIAGKKAVMLVAGAALFSGIAAYGGSSSFWALTAALAVFGLGLGSLEVGSNTIIVDLHRKNKGKYLNLLAFFHGAGSMAAPLYVGQLLAAGFSWRRVYHLSLLAVVLLPVYFGLFKYPGGNDSNSSRIDFRALGRSAFTRKMVSFYLLISAYVAAEIGMASWLVEFLQKAKSQSIFESSLFLSLLCRHYGRPLTGKLTGG